MWQGPKEVLQTFSATNRSAAAPNAEHRVTGTRNDAQETELLVPGEPVPEVETDCRHDEERRPVEDDTLAIDQLSISPRRSRHIRKMKNAMARKDAILNSIAIAVKAVYWFAPRPRSAISPMIRNPRSVGRSCEEFRHWC